MNEKLVNPEEIELREAAAKLAQDSTLKFARNALVITSVLIIMCVAVTVGVLAKRAIFSAKAALSPQEAIRVLLPNGSVGQVQGLAISSNRELTFSVDSPQGSTIYVIDLNSGKLISEVHLVRQSAPVAQLNRSRQ